jgi:hypothetical protein
MTFFAGALSVRSLVGGSGLAASSATVQCVPSKVCGTSQNVV